MLPSYKEQIKNGGVQRSGPSEMGVPFHLCSAEQKSDT